MKREICLSLILRSTALILALTALIIYVHPQIGTRLNGILVFVFAASLYIGNSILKKKYVYRKDEHLDQLRLELLAILLLGLNGAVSLCFGLIFIMAGYSLLLSLILLGSGLFMLGFSVLYVLGVI